MRFSDYAEYIEKNCPSDDYTLSMGSSDKIDIRFAQNAITQNIAGESEFINLNTAFGKKTGSASVNRGDIENLRYLIDTACQVARFNEDDPEYLPSCGKMDLPKIKNCHESTAKIKADKITESIKKIIDYANNNKAKASGIISRNISNNKVKTKNGFYDEDESTIFSISTTLKKGDLETKLVQSFLDYDNFSIDKFISSINDRYESLDKEPRSLPKGRYTVILRPSAVFQFFFFMSFFMDHEQADKGLTFFSDKLGKKIAGENFSLSSTIKDSNMISISNFFNCEPAQDIDWIRNGVLHNLSLYRFYAKKLNKKPCYAYNMLIDGGSSNEQEMMKTAERGIIVNDFWYIRNVDTKKGEITGMTRDGVLYFEDGEIKYPLRNFRFNEIPMEIANRIIKLGKIELTGIRAKVPTMLIDDFNFVDTTSF